MQRSEEKEDRHWRGGILGFYVNRDDPRLWVPKRRPGWGWTLNLGHRRAPLVLAALAVVVIGGLVLAAVMDPA